VLWLWVVVIVILIGLATVVAVGSADSLSQVYDDRPDRTISTGRPLTADDLSEVTFSTAVRGYRMDEVDALVARLRADLLARESAAPDPPSPEAGQAPAAGGATAVEEVRAADATSPVPRASVVGDDDSPVTQPRTSL